MHRENIALYIAIYLRLSREDGDDKESESIGNQREIINRFIETLAKEHKIVIVNEYIDDRIYRD